MSNLLTDPLLSVGGGTSLSLPGLFAAMARAEVVQFPSVRPHQRSAWHMFLVQLGALAVWKAGLENLPQQAGTWTEALRGLAPEFPDDAPWRLTVPNSGLPAFLQPPAPEGLKWRPVDTPDALDVLNTARNHDIKRSINRKATPEDWVLALVSLQTMAGYAGRGKHGVARMNGGFGSRLLVGLVPARPGDLSLNPSAWWARDVRCLIEHREAAPEATHGMIGGPALLWCSHWAEEEQLSLAGLDPWFIEICRRVRLRDTGSAISAFESTSTKPRIDARRYCGNVGDPWAPVHRKDGKCLTIGEGHLDYVRLSDLLFSGDWELPILARPGKTEAVTHMNLVIETLSRGRGTTEGFKSRVLPIPTGPTSGPLAAVATAARTQMEEITVFYRALRYALALAAAGGNWETVETHHYAHARAPGDSLLDAIDHLFFSYLWRRLDDEGARLSDVSAYGTGWGIFIAEDFWLIAVTEGNRDETEIHACQRARREGRHERGTHALRTSWKMRLRALTRIDRGSGCWLSDV